MYPRHARLQDGEGVVRDPVVRLKRPQYNGNDNDHNNDNNNNNTTTTTNNNIHNNDHNNNNHHNNNNDNNVCRRPPGLGHFTSQDLVTCLHSLCADSSSPQISAILHRTVTKIGAEQNPGSRNSLPKAPTGDSGRCRPPPRP